MKIVFISALFILGGNLNAGEIDLELASYIETFKLRPVDKLKGKRGRLFSAGKVLFKDPILSGNRNISCKDCHHPGKGTSDGIALSLGEGAFNGEKREQASGKILKRHSPSLYNLGQKEFTKMFWDGRVSLSNGVFHTPEKALNGALPKAAEIVSPLKRALDAQTIFPILSHEEMRGALGSNEVANAPNNLAAWAVITNRIQKERPGLAKQLQEEFNVNELNIGHIGAALGEFIAFEFQVTQTPFDEYLRGHREALSEDEKRGMKLFFTKGRCGNCHWGPHLTNHAFQNVGVPPILREGDQQDLGLYAVDDRDARHKYAFKNPGLRNVAFSAPYMHNGVYQNLDEVIDHYDNLEANLRDYRPSSNTLIPYRDAIQEASSNEVSVIYQGVFQPFLRRGLGLSQEEKKLIKLFMQKALSEGK